jgi:ligand-binding sensor domain-containing protein
MSRQRRPQGVREYAARTKLAEQAKMAAGMAEKAKEFTEGARRSIMDRFTKARVRIIGWSKKATGLSKSCFAPGAMLCILMTLSPCNAQERVDSIPGEISERSVGKMVVELDAKATLIHQDKTDNYWFGSRNGVYKYDGKSLVLFTQEDGLISHSVIAVQEDNSGSLYFDTQDGVSKYDGQKFTRLEVIEHDSSRAQWKSGPDDLWFRIGWENRGPYRYDGKNLYRLEFPKNKLEDEFNAKHPNAGFNPYSIYSMYKDSKGSMWFGTADMGVYRFDGEIVTWMYERHLMEKPEGGSFGVRSIIEDKDGFILISNSAYKYRVLSDDVEGAEPFPIPYIRVKGIGDNEKEARYFMAMAVGSNGELWAVNSDGVWRGSDDELTHFAIKSGDKSIPVSSVFRDNHGDIWVGTQGDGSYKYNGKTFEKFKIN